MKANKELSIFLTALFSLVTILTIPINYGNCESASQASLDIYQSKAAQELLKPSARQHSIKGNTSSTLNTKSNIKGTPASGTSKKNNLAFPIDLLYSPYVSWGVSPNDSAGINVKDAWSYYQFQKDVTVAVLDTGIEPTHPFFDYDNITVKEGSLSTSNNFGVDFSKNYKLKNAPFDTHGHGTHVSGIIKSIYPKVKLLPLKYYSQSASGQENLVSTISALRYAVENNVDIINYSGGGPEASLDELKLLKEAESKGILVVVAAGNEESNIDNKANRFFPASYMLSNIISVTAYNQFLQILPSSNYGKLSVDIAAPGNRIKSSVPPSRATMLTGTSQATAFVTGVAALVKSNYPEFDGIMIKKIITRSAKIEKQFETKCISGGRVDAKRALLLAKSFKDRGTRQLANNLTNLEIEQMITDAERSFDKKHNNSNFSRAISNSNLAKIESENNLKEGKIIYRLKSLGN